MRLPIARKAIALMSKIRNLWHNKLYSAVVDSLLQQVDSRFILREMVQVHDDARYMMTFGYVATWLRACRYPHVESHGRAHAVRSVKYCITETQRPYAGTKQR